MVEWGESQFKNTKALWIHLNVPAGSLTQLGAILNAGDCVFCLRFAILSTEVIH